MTDKLRVALIGAGRIGLVHAENLAHRVRGGPIGRRHHVRPPAGG